MKLANYTCSLCQRSISAVISAGIGAEKNISSPVRGCVKPNVRAVQSLSWAYLHAVGYELAVFG